jgi:DNA-nicking Smr family endonuclease
VHDDLDTGVPVELPLTDVLDLHSFPPSEVAALVRDYLEIAREKNWRHVRLIHGKGRGVQRQMVRKILERDPGVESFSDAAGDAGGWGATLVTLRRSGD